MPKPFDRWTVLPHDKLVRLDENLLTVTGTLEMPLMETTRRMTVARLASGQLVVYSAIALGEPEMKALERFGAPTFLVVPNDLHRMDAKIWKARYPEMKVIAPPAARAKVGEVVPVDATAIDFGDPNVRWFVVAGTGDREAGLLVEGASGTTLILNDLIFNLANRPGIAGWLMKAIGMTSERPHIPSVVKMREVKDDAALRAQLEEWSRMPTLNRVVISHGEIITRDAPQVLSRIAAELAA